ncbi:MAG TPA: MarR family transcriptional regulator [Gaiellales bacterium]|nr:MarR family transcriptional regulator [Gaiellales bacterium]
MNSRRSRTAGLASDLLSVVGPLQRLLRRRVREDWPLEPLPTAQIDLLRAVALRPGLTVGEVAFQLRIAPNTASTLVNQLVVAGLVVRRQDEVDRRSIRLVLTAAAEARISAWRDRRQELLYQALDRLNADERAAIAAAMPALRRLRETLDR